MRKKDDELCNRDELDLVTATIFGEARGEPIEGKVAVGWVIKNRVLDDRWPCTYKDVVLQPKQFSCWNKTDPNYPDTLRATVPTLSWRSLAWQECRLVAHGIIYDRLRDNTQDSNHYHAINIIELPKWADGLKVMKRYGNHVFYKL